MKFKASKYNILVTTKQENFLFNTYSGSAVQLRDIELKKLNEILCNTHQFEEIDSDKEIIIDFLLKHEFIVPFNKNELRYVMNRYNNMRLDTSDLSLLITPTLKCNMKCFYCYQNRENKNSLNINEDIDAIVRFADNKLESSRKFNVTWFGGEPLYYKRFVYKASTALINLAERRNAQYSASIVSNGYLLDASAVCELKKYRVKSIQITLDGSQVQHDKVRRHLNPVTNKREDSFSTIIKNVNNASTFFDISLRINISQFNFKGIETLIDELAFEGLAEKEVQLYFHPVFNYIVTNPTADYRPNDNIHLKIQDFSILESQWLHYAKQKGFKIRDPYKTGNSGCFAVQKNSYIIESSGEVKKCNNDIGKPGTAFTSIMSTKSIDNHNISIWENYKPDNIKECKNCVFLPLCYSHCPHRNINSPEERVDKCPSLKFNWQNTIPLFLKQRRELNV
jgi:uncharacterized protein